MREKGRKKKSNEKWVGREGKGIGKKVIGGIEGKGIKRRNANGRTEEPDGNG